MEEQKALSLRYFPEDLKNRLKILAVKKRTTLNALIIALLNRAIKKEG